LYRTLQSVLPTPPRHARSAPHPFSPPPPPPPSPTLFPYTTLFRSHLPKLHALRDLVGGEVSPAVVADLLLGQAHAFPRDHPRHQDRKSTRLNSSHVSISYAVFCLKKKK